MSSSNAGSGSGGRRPAGGAHSASGDSTEGLKRLTLGGGGSSGGSKRRPEDAVHDFCRTRPAHITDKVGVPGTTSQPISLRANFAVVQAAHGDLIYQYHVDFTPPVDSQKVRQDMLRSCTTVVGEFHLFNGQILYLPASSPPSQMEVTVQHPATHLPVQLRIRKTGSLVPDDPQTITVLNVLNRRAMELMDFRPFGRHFFDPSRASQIERLKLEVWPGMVSSVRPYENQLLMCIDTAHKMLRKDSVFVFMNDLYMKYGKGGFREQVEAQLCGQTIITRYNNKTYRVDAVEWEKNPESTFEKADGTTTSFKAYYEATYGLPITNPQQPLIMSRAKKFGPARKDVEMATTDCVYLVPELCWLTGLTDDMRANRSVMQELAQFTRVPPMRRVDDARDRLTRLNADGSSAKALFNQWGMSVEQDLVRIQARRFNTETLFGASPRPFTYQAHSADWSREIKGVAQYKSVHLQHWGFVTPSAISNQAQAFYQCMKKVAPRLGMQLAEPFVSQLENSSNVAYMDGINACMSSFSDKCQMVLALVPDDGKARYDTIKKHCSQKIGVPSQVLLKKTVDRDRILESICLKVMIQMNCKLGGAPWRIDSKFPRPVMVVGYDCYYDSSLRGSQVTACVCSMDKDITKFNSQYTTANDLSCPQTPLATMLNKSLSEFSSVNGGLPSKVFVYRDGVGEGQIPVVFNKELAQVKDVITCLHKQAAANNPDVGAEPQLVFIIVNKKINHRFFLEQGNGQFVNPQPGTVVDSVVTRQERYDFYMVPQSVNQGTVTPVAYNVIYDGTKLSPAQQQLWAYKLCHLYYNWQGTIRVPAPCMYAYKLAFMISQYIHGDVQPQLLDTLFFL